MFTEQNCKDVGITLGMPEEKSLDFYHHYNAQGWVFGSGLKIVNLKSAMWRWKKNGYRFEKKDKRKLLPIVGKHCSEDGCGMPAVYKYAGRSSDFWYCSDHMPEKVKEKYE